MPDFLFTLDAFQHKQICVFARVVRPSANRQQHYVIIIMKKVTHLCDNAMQFNGKTLHSTRSCTHPWMITLESKNSYFLLLIMNCYAVFFHLKKGQKHEFITQTGLSGS